MSCDNPQYPIHHVTCLVCVMMVWSAGFHIIDLDTGVVQDLYPSSPSAPIKPHAIITIPRTNNTELLLCYDSKSLNVDQISSSRICLCFTSPFIKTFKTDTRTHLSTRGLRCTTTTDLFLVCGIKWSVSKCCVVSRTDEWPVLSSAVWFVEFLAPWKRFSSPKEAVADPYPNICCLVAGVLHAMLPSPWRRL